MTIGHRIKILRRMQGLSIDELACKLGKNRTTVYRYENGDIENLPIGILDSLADALNTTPACLMGWTDMVTHEIIDNDVGMKLKHITMWSRAFPDVVFTEEECSKVIEYAKFIISQRDK